MNSHISHTVLWRYNDMLEFIRELLGIGSAVLLFGLIPGIMIGAYWHRFFLEEEC